MALHIRVWDEGQGFIGIRGEWEDGKPFDVETLEKESGSTAAEQVELHLMTDHNLVASWLWSASNDFNKRMLHGQFVCATALPGRKALKEVDDSLAHKFDL